jgi:putative ATP-binding cassette transporter
MKLTEKKERLMSGNSFFIKIFIFCFVLFLLVNGVEAADDGSVKEIESFVQDIMKEAKIPGMSVIIVKGTDFQYVKGFGYANLKEKVKVSPLTKFELGSCSKAFTALAVLQLEEKGLIDLNDPVSRYFPWFFVKYKNQKYKISIRQLLHHASGIPSNTISLIPQGNREDALEQTVRNIVGIELNNIPGKQFEYATVNYDIAGAIIEKVTGKTFEEYMLENVFKPLGLNHTTVGADSGGPDRATGYKIGFFAPRRYTPPIYRGNNPAGYIISNGEDIARWLKIQLGLEKTDLSGLIQKSHTPDLTMLAGKTLSFYAMGWFVVKIEKSEFKHGGFNPNFTAYINFNPQDKVGVAVLANSNSSYTPLIGDHVMNLVAKREAAEIRPPENKIDAVASIASLIIGVILIAMLIYLIFKLIGIFRGQKRFEPITLKKIGKLVGAIVMCMPFFVGIYLLPGAISNVSWQIVIVWGPISISVLLLFLLAFFVLFYTIFCLSLFFPDPNRYRNTIPVVMALNIIASLAGMVLVPIIIGALFSRMAVGYLIFYFGLALCINIMSSRFAAAKMIHFSNDLILDMRVDLFKKLLTTSYQKFEKILDGRIFTTLNDDIGSVIGAVGLFMEFVSNSVIVIAGVIYLSTISLFAAVAVVVSSIALAIYYTLVSIIAKVFMEEARTAQNVYMSLLNGLIKGYKELSINQKKKDEYKDDLVDSCDDIREKGIIAAIKFLNSNIIGTALSTIVIGLFCILVPRLLTNVNIFVIVSLIMVILYIRGPISAIIGIMPRVTGIRVAWGRIKQFNRDIDPLDRDYSIVRFFRDLDRPGQRSIVNISALSDNSRTVENLKVEELMFKYETEVKEEQFEVGPINFEVKKGEILFITGGNGSGKTTLIKLLSGLYKPDRGTIKIDEKEMSLTQLSEYYSAVFSDYHLFKKLYTIDTKSKEAEIQKYLSTLQIEEKVRVEGNSFSTIDLSGGQRKRLALVQCYLEDRPIYLFDELAADQDPGFRNYIYRDLFIRMKEEGKIVIACTHDDHYFDAADKLIKMDMGKIDFIENGYGKEWGKEVLLPPVPAKVAEKSLKP